MHAYSTLDLSSNQLSGAIPSTLANLIMVTPRPR